jgi:PAS domain S-box-containing protein
VPANKPLLDPDDPRGCPDAIDPVAELESRLADAQARIAQLEAMEEQYRVNLENLYLHQEELRTQNDELRHAQTSLETARRRHQDLFDFAPIAHFLVSASGMILKTNRAAASLLGLDVQELYGFHMPNLANNNSQRAAILAFLEAVDGGQSPPPLEVELFRRDGGSARVELHGSRSGAHQETSLLLTAVDMGHHAALENERRTVDEERLLAAAVFEQCGHGVVVTDASWRIQRINPAFAALTGRGEQAALGQALDRIVANGQDEARNWRMWQELRENGAWRGETTTRRPDGGERSLRLRIGAIRDRAGNTRHYIGFVDGG